MRYQRLLSEIQLILEHPTNGLPHEQFATFLDPEDRFYEQLKKGEKIDAIHV